MPRPWGCANSATAQVAEAITKKERPSVIWLHHQECTGCTESLLRAEHPTLEKLILDIISLDYHETLFAAAGHQVEAARQAAQEKNKGKYLLVVEGAIPMKDGGIYCKIGGQTVARADEGGGGWRRGRHRASAPAPRGAACRPRRPTRPAASASREALGRKDILTIPGCPSNPYNFLACVVHFLTFGKLPALDAKGRPKFAYGRLIHENCERRAHFDAGRFALEFGDEGHRKGYCLYKLGCKGPETYANCPTILFGDVGQCSPGRSAWAIPASAAREKGIGFTKPIHALADLKNQRPPVGYRARRRGAGHGPEYGRQSRWLFRRRWAPRLARARCSPRSSARSKAAQKRREPTRSSRR